MFVLAPVAVATDRQGEGIGRRLLNHGLATPRSVGVDIVMTDGDPNDCAKAGFTAISEADAQASHLLDHPEVWLGQSLTHRAMARPKGQSRCVEMLNDPVFW